MAYFNVEDALASRLDNIAGFATAAGTGNVTKGDYRVLGRGVGSALIIEYNGFEQERVELAGQHHITWQFNVNLFARVQDELAAANILGTARQLVIDEINSRPLLGGTASVFDAIVSEGASAPENINMGDVRFAFEILRCSVTEEVSVSYAE